MKREVWIIGAGPVGLLLAHLLHQKGFRIHLFEKRAEIPDLSMAIGITPPSLNILATLGLREAFESQGILIRRARVFENRNPVGSLGFEQAGDHILSLPQRQSLRLFRESLAKLPDVLFHENETFTLNTVVPENVRVIGCDGHRSTVRQRAGIKMKAKNYKQKFLMADFEDLENAGSDARLFFSPRGSVESFPLPGHLRRWVVQVLPGQPSEVSHIIERVRDAAGVNLAGVPHGTPSSFIPRRAIASHFHRGAFVLCGDAAHQLSPIGGQGMNTGFADAYQLAEALTKSQPLKLWTKHRTRAFNQAATRAALGMKLGTLTGIPASKFRARILHFLLNNPRSSQTLSRSYAMLNLSYPVQP
ncbi:NAD(P)/FAD-dependent oxidoreductase [Kiritimatiellaeota bacterium B1221]|nr:NAD(P)/FAD-dependent oxidoreductase [Kiritimatiellaeota bacterium B1221]